MRKLLFVLLAFACAAVQGADYLYYPIITSPIYIQHSGQPGTNLVLATATHKVAFIGYADMLNTASGAKLCSTSCTVEFVLGSVTWANATSSITIGIQNVSTAAGPPAQPDGSFVVSSTCAKGSSCNVANGWNTKTMDTGSLSISRGDLISVVFDLTAKGGSDTLYVGASTTNITTHSPTTSYYTGSWATAQNVPNVVITTNDGTTIWLSGSANYTSQAITTFKSDDAANEYCTVFTAPPGYHTVEGFASYSQAAASADMQYTLYAGTASPVLLATVSVDNHNWAASASSRPRTALLSSGVNLVVGAQYAACIKATTTNLVGVSRYTLASSSINYTWPGNSTVLSGTRGGGAITTSDTVRTMIGVILSTDRSGSCCDNLTR